MRLALLGLVYTARAWRETADDALARGRIDKDYHWRIGLMVDEFIALVAPRDDMDFRRPVRGGAVPNLGDRQAFRADLHRVADRMPAYALYARVAAQLDADAAEYAAEGSYASALARRELAAFLRTMKVPAWARGLRLFAWGQYGEKRAW